jgi:hypothetical protein
VALKVAIKASQQTRVRADTDQRARLDPLENHSWWALAAAPIVPWVKVAHKGDHMRVRQTRPTGFTDAAAGLRPVPAVRLDQADLSEVKLGSSALVHALDGVDRRLTQPLDAGGDRARQSGAELAADGG